jgi:hypothetical protein
MPDPPVPHDDDRQLAPVAPAVSGPPPSPAYAPVPRPVTYEQSSGDDPVEPPPGGERDGANRTDDAGPSANPWSEALASDDDPAAIDPLAPPRHRMRVRLILATVVLAIIGAAGVVLATGGSDGERGSEPATGTSEAAPGDPSAPQTDEPPVEATKQLIAAVEAGDCAGIVSRATSASLGLDRQTVDEAVAECESGAGAAASLTAAEFGDVSLVDASGSRATVSVVVTLGGQANEREVPVHRINGRWRLDLSSLTPASSLTP